MEELESKLNAYYALEKESKRSVVSPHTNPNTQFNVHRSEGESPKRSLDSPSPTREQKARQAVAEAAASVSASGGKWKMQIGNATAGSSRFKKKPEREEWAEEQEKRMQGKNGDVVEDPAKKVPQPLPPPPDKNLGVRKVMALKEPQPPPKKEPEPMKKPKVLPPAPTTKPMITPGQVVLDKFGNFRLVTPPESKKPTDDAPPLPPGVPPKGYGGTCTIWLFTF